MIIQHSSGSQEHYTPNGTKGPPIVEAIHAVMGGIDLDPASCAVANQIVQANVWYGPGSDWGEDGLAEPWLGKVYLNPPGGTLPAKMVKERGFASRSQVCTWWARLVEYWQAGDVEQAIFMGFTLEFQRTIQGVDVLQPLELPHCVPNIRLPFGTTNRIREKGKKAGELIDPTKEEGEWVLQNQPAHANMIIYLPPYDDGSLSWSAIGKFRMEFSNIGLCTVPMSDMMLQAAGH